MRIDITFISDTTPQPQPIRTLIKWSSDVALRDGYGTPNRLNPSTGELVGQFAMCPVYVTDNNGVWDGTWAENSLATRLTHDQLQQIAALQIADVVNGTSYSVKQKMGWLCAANNPVTGWGSPINTMGVDYQLATDVRMIAAVYAGQPVALTGETMMRKVDLQGHVNQELLWRVKSYNPSQWNRSNAQLVTAVSSENVYTEMTKGKIVLPVYFGDRQAYVLERWLVR